MWRLMLRRAGLQQPVALDDGAEDHIAPAELVRLYLQRVHAPAKCLSLIPGAGHFAPMTHTAEFAAELLQDLRRIR